jgi:hypothetical protein
MFSNSFVKKNFKNYSFKWIKFECINPLPANMENMVSS